MNEEHPNPGAEERTDHERNAADGPVFPDAAAFTEAAEAYFSGCDERGALYGEAGLCLYLSAHNPGRRVVRLETLRAWWDGEGCDDALRDAVQLAYLRIQAQIESDERYCRSGMGTRVTLLQKQPRFGGYQERGASGGGEVRLNMGPGLDISAFE